MTAARPTAAPPVANRARQFALTGLNASRELDALQDEFEHLERKYVLARRALQATSGQPPSLDSDDERPADEEPLDADERDSDEPSAELEQLAVGRQPSRHWPPPTGFGQLEGPPANLMPVGRRRQLPVKPQVREQPAAMSAANQLAWQAAARSPAPEPAQQQYGAWPEQLARRHSQSNQALAGRLAPGERRNTAAAVGELAASFRAYSTAGAVGRPAVAHAPYELEPRPAGYLSAAALLEQARPPSWPHSPARQTSPRLGQSLADAAAPPFAPLLLRPATGKLYQPP